MPQLSVQSLTDALADSLRGRIFDGDLGPGDALTEAGLAGHYSVARPTAKAAIERLTSEGLLERVAHKSARVPVMDIARIQDMYFARQFMESQANRMLAEQRTPTPEAAHANDQLRAAAKSGALSDLVEWDIRFHRALIDGIHSPRISKAHSALINEMRLCLVQVQTRHLLDPEIIANEHAGILDAITAGQDDHAARLSQEHLNHAMAQLTKSLGN